VEKTTSIEKKTMDIEERGVKLRLTVVDTPGKYSQTLLWKNISYCHHRRIQKPRRKYKFTYIRATYYVCKKRNREVTTIQGSAYVWA
jgi:hypothetical protein